jgi:[histone H3]-lysine36 N-dimethyltransferase SETMAR
LERLNDEINKKRPHFKKKKVLFHQDDAPCHKTMAKLHELGYELLPYLPYSPDLAPSDFFLIADIRRMLTRKKFSTNEEVIAETEAYFDAMSKPYYKNGIDKFYDRYNRCVYRPRKELYLCFTMLAYELFSPTVI